MATSKVKEKGTCSFSDWLIRTGLGQFETKLRLVGIKDVSSFTELDNDDLNEMNIIDMKSRLALLSVVQYVNENLKSVSKLAPLITRLDSTEPTSFSAQSDKVSIGIVGSIRSGKTNFAVQFISGKSMVDHEATLIDAYIREIDVDNSKCLVSLIDCGGEYGENLDVASTDGFIVCHRANDMASLNFALKLIDEIIAIKDTTALLPDTKWPIVLARTHHDKVEGGSLLMLPQKYANLNLAQYDLALGEFSYTDCCIHQMVQSVRAHRRSYCKPQEIDPTERRKGLIGYWALQSIIGTVDQAEFPIMELDKWGNVRWHTLNHESNLSDDYKVDDENALSLLLFSTGFAVDAMLSQITFNSEKGASVSFLFAFDRDNHLIIQYMDDDDESRGFKLFFNLLNQLPYPDLLPVSLSSCVDGTGAFGSGDIQLIATDGQKFQVHSAVLHARCLGDRAKQLSLNSLPYSSNVIKGLLIYLYTNAPPLSTASQKSECSPVLTHTELAELSQLAEMLGLTQLVQFSNLSRDVSMHFEIKESPSDVSEIFQQVGLEMDRVCFFIYQELSILDEEVSSGDHSEKKQLGVILAAVFNGEAVRVANQKVLLMLYNYHNKWKKLLLKSQKRAFLAITLEWFKDAVNRYYCFLTECFKLFKARWGKPENQISSLQAIVDGIAHVKKQDPEVFTKNAGYIKDNLDTFLEAALKSKPKSLVHMGRNIPKMFKIRKTVKSLQQFKKQLPFLVAEVTKELEFIAQNHTHPDAYKRCNEFVKAMVEFTYSKEKLIPLFKAKFDKMSVKEWKAFINKCGGKLNYFISNVKKFSYADHLWKSRVSGRPRKLGRLLGVDMAWEVGILNEKPDLEFPEAEKYFESDIESLSTVDNAKYLEFHKYQNLMSETIGEDVSKKTKDVESQQSNELSAKPPAESITPLAGLGMDLQYLLMQSCSIPFDVHFQLDDGSLLGAHSVVVCARCSWFMNALESGMKESVERKISLPGVSTEAANAFMFILYTGSLPNDILSKPPNYVAVLAEIMCLSHRLELYDMFSICEAKLVHCINEENAVTLLTYADGLQAQLLYGKCVRFVTAHPSLHKSEELKDLSPKTTSFIEGELMRANGQGRESPQHLARNLKPFYFKQMSRCETFTVAQTAKVTQKPIKQDSVRKSASANTGNDTVSVKDIIKDLQRRAKMAQDAVKENTLV